MPAMYKVKDFKDIPGVGMAHQLLEKEGRKPLADKDIKSLQPVEPPAKDAGKGGEAAPAAAAGGGDAGGGGGGDAGGGAEAEAAAANDDDAGDEAATNDGDEGSLDVEMVQQTQCCGGLKKSAVCSLL